MKAVHCHTAPPLRSAQGPCLERLLAAGPIAWGAPMAGSETHGVPSGVLADFVGGGRAP